MEVKKTLAKFAVGTTSLVVSTLPDDPISLLIKTGWGAAIVSWNLAYDLFPTESTVFWKKIQNATELAKTVTSSTEFKQSIASSFETFYKTRSKPKRDLIIEIYTTGYLPSKNLKSFELERLNETARIISLPALVHLRFLIEVILPIRETELDKKIKKINSERNADMLRRGEAGINPLSKFVMDWVHKNHHVDVDIYKTTHTNIVDPDDIVNRFGREENKIYDKFAELQSELISLSILKTKPTYDTQGYEFTDFGLEFGKYVKKISLENNKKLYKVDK